MENQTALEHKIRTYARSTDGRILTRDEEGEIFGYLREMQKEMLREVVSFDKNILREALGKYARVEEYFSREQIADWDHQNKTLGYVRKSLYHQYLRKERKLKSKETSKSQHRFVEWYRQNLSRECFVDICKLYLERLETAPNLNGGKKEKQEHFQDDASKVDEVYSVMIHLNQGLVKAVYKDLSSIVHICIADGIAEEEILQGGNMGLVTVIDKFDHLRGYKFSTYARWWIRNGIERVLLNSSESFRALSNFNKRSYREGEEKQLLPEQLEEFRALNAFLHTVSLNAPSKIRGDNDDKDLIDFLPDINSPNPEEMVLAVEIPKSITQALSEAVSPRERDVMIRTYGLNGREKQNSEDIGKDYDCTGSNVRRVHAEAIQKLRKYFRKKRNL